MRLHPPFVEVQTGPKMAILGDPSESFRSLLHRVLHSLTGSVELAVGVNPELLPIA
jgi:hypothetical protein